MRKVIDHLALIFAFLLILSPGYGQKILYPQIRPSDARFDNLEIDNGKAGMTVYSLLQDSKGFIWCSADAGLYRYDGSRFLRFSYGQNDTCLLGYLANTIYEDRKGTIWVGTHGGLNRINNSKRLIDHFIPDTTDLLSHDNSVRLIREDKEGMLWILTDRNVFRFDTGNFSFKRFDVDSLPLRSLDAVIVDEEDKFVEDIKGNIWIATNKGLFRYRKKDQLWEKVFPSETDPTQYSDPKVNCIKEDSSGNLYIGSESCGLLRIKDPDNGSYETIRKKTKGTRDSSVLPVTAIFCLLQNEVWFTESNTICKLVTHTQELTEFIISDRDSPNPKWNGFIRINKITKGSGNEIWMISYGSGILFRFNTLTENVSCFLVPRYIVLRMMRDRSGNLWFGCVANDIFILVTNGLPYRSGMIQNSTGVAFDYTSNYTEDKEGNILIATWNGILRLKNPLKTDMLVPEKTNYDYDGHRASGIFTDSQDNLWICYSGGLICEYDSAGKKTGTLLLPGGHYSEEEGVIKIIREDKNGNLWFVTNDAGIFKLEKGGKEIKLKYKNEEITGTDKFETIMDFNIDRENNIWLSTYFGLYRINQATRKVDNLNGFEGSGLIFGNAYYRILVDKSERLWILCTIRSPYYYDFESKSFVCPYAKELMPALSYFDMQIDNKGRIWLADNNIITVFDTISRIRTDYPVQMNGFAPKSFITSYGKVLYFIGSKSIMFPSEKSFNENIPPIMITSLLVNNMDYHRKLNRWQSTEILKEAVLRYDENNLKIEFAALNYVNPGKNKYRFIMEGVDRDTSVSEGNPAAEYRNMSPGKYIFWVTGSNNDGVWNQAGTSLKIIIHPPWYKSSIAYFIYLLLTTAMIFLYIRLRLRALLKEKLLLENEVRMRTEELEIKNKKLAEIDRIKTDFFTDISHEIRTPLTLITGPVDLLLKSFETNSKVYNALSSVKRNAGRLLHLVNELLDISRLDEGKMKINLTEDDIIKNLRILVFEFLSLAESRRINYIVEIPESPFITWFDRDKTNRIITNLLTNAFKFTPENGTVKCLVRLEESNNIPGKILQITVSDTGKGIGREHVDKIFDRFYRIEGRQEDQVQGTGIGLSLTREFVLLLHGIINVRSEIGAGSVFSVEIPLGTDHLDKSEYAISAIQPFKNEIVAGLYENIEALQNTNNQNNFTKSILVIEDNQELRSFIAGNLSDQFHVIESGNGKTGISLALSMLPDLIISDIMMPDTNGLELCSKLKHDELTSHIPIILLTAKATSEDKLSGLKSGADDYIIKPFSLEELRARINNLLAIREKLKMKYLSPANSNHDDTLVKSVDYIFMEKVINLINNNISNFDFDVNFLHNALGISRMHLSRKIRALTGLSPHILIRNIRLEKAASLLRNNAGNITEIANSVGMSNPANFTKSFAEYFGTSPRNYIKQFKTSGKNLQ